MIDKDLNINTKLCNGCGACVSSCNTYAPNGTKAISLVTNKQNLLVAKIDKKYCISCMACYKACPVQDKIFNTNYDNYTSKIGETYFGYVKNETHRYNAATAGIATELAATLLKNNQYDCVICCNQNNNNEIIVNYTNKIEEVYESKGSIYRQVPLLKDIIEKLTEKACKKVVLIGLPCHIAALKKLQENNLSIKKIDFFTISLFCKQTKTDEYSNSIRHLIGEKDNNKKINYRGKGWPGYCYVKLKKIKFDDIKISLMWQSFAFSPKYCLTCSDPLGKIADISVGDAWGLKSENRGKSYIIASTTKGNDALLLARKNIYLTKVNKDIVINSQGKSTIAFKTKYPNYRAGMNLQDKKIPIKYKLLLQWILLNKPIVEFLYRTRIINFIPKITIKIYTRTVLNLFKKHLS